MSTLDKAIKTCDGAFEQNVSEMVSLARKMETIDQEITKLKDQIKKISRDFSKARSYVMSHDDEASASDITDIKEAIGMIHNLKNINI